MSNTKLIISQPALGRLVRYLHYLTQLAEDAGMYTSATAIAEALALNQVQVRKDLAAVSQGGRPKVGYVRSELIHEIESFLGYDNLTDAILVGVGNLGKALLSYEGFANHGLNIVAGFDTDPAIIGSEVHGKKIVSSDRLVNLCRRMNIHIGILAVPPDAAQVACDLLLKGGVLAIWNFTPMPLSVPDHIIVKNENLVESFVVLSRMLTDRLQESNRVSEASLGGCNT